MGSYIPSNADERREMLDEIGCDSLEALYADVPAELLKAGPPVLPDGLSELELRESLTGIAAQNTVFGSIFRGAGAYNHYIPSIVKYITSKEEFVTAYTPYQAEISQGVLQSIFEYQTSICELTGMDVSNASVYDGASAAAEAIHMCVERKRTRALAAEPCNPAVLGTIKTYCFGSNAGLKILPHSGGKVDLGALKAELDDTVACVYVQQPNYYGLLEDIEQIAAIVHGAGAKLIVGCNPIALGLIKSPGECGADIAVGEGQPLGMPLAFGGPYLGFMACKGALMRKLPGRIVGQTTDVDGNRAFVLTLQAREQHIRREKASSNICSNQALCAMTASLYLAVMGPSGLKEVAGQSCSKAHYAAQRLSESGLRLRYDAPFFNEFLTECPAETGTLLRALEEKGILGGLPVDGGLLWCATEQNSREAIDSLADAIKEALA